jgi:hypothetical protein
MISCISFRVGRTKALPRRRVAGHELFSTTNRHCGVAPCAHFATVEGSWNEQREQRLGNLCVECPSLNGADNVQAAFADAGYPCKTHSFGSGIRLSSPRWLCRGPECARQGDRARRSKRVFNRLRGFQCFEGVARISRSCRIERARHRTACSLHRSWQAAMCDQLFPEKQLASSLIDGRWSL